MMPDHPTQHDNKETKQQTSILASAVMSSCCSAALLSCKTACSPSTCPAMDSAFPGASACGQPICAEGRPVLSEGDSPGRGSPTVCGAATWWGSCTSNLSMLCCRYTCSSKVQVGCGPNYALPVSSMIADSTVCSCLLPQAWT